MRLYEDHGRFIKYLIVNYEEFAGSFAPSALVIVLDTNMGGRTFAGSQMTPGWQAALFFNSREVDL